ncbi:hypothetical protein J1614_003839 [Plenodomus biglobosus]|nr:hypothetical protein J1614_003839 [Plenodomus biglobosus]
MYGTLFNNNDNTRKHQNLLLVTEPTPRIPTLDPIPTRRPGHPGLLGLLATSTLLLTSTTTSTTSTTSITSTTLIPCTLPFLPKPKSQIRQKPIHNIITHPMAKPALVAKPARACQEGAARGVWRAVVWALGGGGGGDGAWGVGIYWKRDFGRGRGNVCR